MAQEVETVLTVSGAGVQGSGVVANKFYSTILVQNDTASPIYVTTDGTVPSNDAGAESEILAGQTAEFDNELGLPNSNLNAGLTATNFQCGVDGSRSQSEAVNWTAQQAQADTGATNCQVYAVATAGTVNVTFQ
jgi:hypothetical protein